MTKRRARKAPPPAAVIIDRRAWRQWQEAQAELGQLVPAARDLVLQLRELLDVKKRQSAAGHKAAQTRAAAAPAGDLTPAEATAAINGAAELFARQDAAEEGRT